MTTRWIILVLLGLSCGGVTSRVGGRSVGGGDPTFEPAPPQTYPDRLRTRSLPGACAVAARVRESRVCGTPERPCQLLARIALAAWRPTSLALVRDAPHLLANDGLYVLHPTREGFGSRLVAARGPIFDRGGELTLGARGNHHAYRFMRGDWEPTVPWVEGLQPVADRGGCVFGFVERGGLRALRQEPDGSMTERDDVFRGELAALPLLRFSEDGSPHLFVRPGRSGWDEVHWARPRSRSVSLSAGLANRQVAAGVVGGEPHLVAGSGNRVVHVSLRDRERVVRQFEVPASRAPSNEPGWTRESTVEVHMDGMLVTDRGFRSIIHVTERVVEVRCPAADTSDAGHGAACELQRRPVEAPPARSLILSSEGAPTPLPVFMHQAILDSEGRIHGLSDGDYVVLGTREQRYPARAAPPPPPEPAPLAAIRETRLTSARALRDAGFVRTRSDSPSSTFTPTGLRTRPRRVDQWTLVEPPAVGRHWFAELVLEHHGGEATRGCGAGLQIGDGGVAAGMWFDRGGLHYYSAVHQLEWRRPSTVRIERRPGELLTFVDGVLHHRVPVGRAAPGTPMRLTFGGFGACGAAAVTFRTLRYGPVT